MLPDLLDTARGLKPSSIIIFDLKKKVLVSLSSVPMYVFLSKYVLEIDNFSKLACG